MLLCIEYDGVPISHNLLHAYYALGGNVTIVADAGHRSLAERRSGSFAAATRVPAALETDIVHGFCRQRYGRAKFSAGFRFSVVDSSRLFNAVCRGPFRPCTSQKLWL